MGAERDLAIATGTHVGLVHHTNEDSFAVFTTEDDAQALVVCDGMGGMGRGDEASRIAVEVIEQYLVHGHGFPPERMQTAIMAADVQIRKKLAVPGNTPGSTAVVCYVQNGLAHVCWAGDSRAYHLRDGAVLARTRDHKLVNQLVDSGDLTETEAKRSSLAHVVTKALGGRGPREPTVRPDVLEPPWKLKTGDLLLLCSDGLCDLVDDHEIPGVLAGASLEEGVERLTRLALDRGGHDNITLILARWDGQDFDEDACQTPVMSPLRDNLPLPEEDLDDPATVDIPVPVPEPSGDPSSSDGEEPSVDDAPLAAPSEVPDPAPRAPEPEELPNRRLAVGIAILAVLLIVFAILLAQGVFTRPPITVAK